MKVTVLLCIIVFIVSVVNVSGTVRMGIISNTEYCGERELAWRIKIAAQSLGWDVFLDESRGRNLLKVKDLDWVICLLSNNYYTRKDCPNYLTIFHPFEFLDKEGKLLPFYRKYNGYLLTVNRKESIETSLREENKGFFSVPFYPTIYPVAYKKLELNHLMTMVPVWGNRLMDEKFKTLYKRLSQTDQVKFYGVHRNSRIIEKGYMGSIPFDGVSVVKILQKHGIILILHSDIHNKEEIPSSRIFEAAAASTVIICDENAFVKEHFGDNVFYVNTSKSSEEIYQQIRRHMNTISSNPKKALDMAKNAHDIFTSKFLMTDQLLKLYDMHQQHVHEIAQ